LRATTPLERRKDGIQDPLDVAVDLVIAEASYPIAPILQELFSRPIAMSFILG